MALPAALGRRQRLGRPLPEQDGRGEGDELGIDDGELPRAEEIDQGLVGRDGGARVDHLERGADANEVVLHVDDQQGRVADAVSGLDHGKTR